MRFFRRRKPEPEVEAALREAAAADPFTIELHVKRSPEPPRPKGWVTFVMHAPEHEAHVIPEEQQGTISHHHPTPLCWCFPAKADDTQIGDGNVWLHRRAHDDRHVYEEDEE